MKQLIGILLLLASVAHAAPIAKVRRKYLPPLDEVRVFTSVDHPNVQLIYGRTKAPGRTCRPYVIEIGRERTHVPRIDGTVVGDDGVTVIFRDGRRLVMSPDGPGGSILHLQRHREPLTERAFDAGAITELSRRVTFGPGTEPATVFAPLAHPRSGDRVYQITIHEAAEAARLDHEGPYLIAQQDNGTTVDWWAFGAEADQIEGRARALGIAITRFDHLPADRLPAYPPGIGYAPPPVRDVWRHLKELERAVRKAHDIEWSIRYFTNHENALRSFREHFRGPLHDRITAAYAALRADDTDLGLELYLWSSGTVGPRVSQLDLPAGSERGTFFAEWLNMLEHRVGWTSRSGKIQANVTTLGGHFAPNFPDVTLNFVDFGHPKAVPYLHGHPPTYPLRLLGLKNSARVRNALISFIAAADKQAEWQRRILQTDFVRAPMTGNMTLARVIRALPYGVVNHREDPGFPAVKFRPALYYTQVAQILTELLNTSAVSLINMATYLTAVDAALTLQTEIKREFGRNPSAGGHSLEKDALTNEVFKLYEATQKQLMRMCAVQLLGEEG